ncbi:MAG: T9SS type A sorting domain-containing protein [Bacteroidota bacterium]
MSVMENIIPITPFSPGSLTIKAVSASELILTWNAAIGTPISYYIYRSTTSGTGYMRIDSVSANQTTYFSTGLMPNTKYWYQITAVIGQSESAPSNQDSATTFIKPSASSAFTGTGSALFTSIVPIIFSLNMNAQDTLNLLCYYALSSDTTKWFLASNVSGKMSAITKSGSDTIYWNCVNDLSNTESAVKFKIVPLGIGVRGDSAIAAFIIDREKPRFIGLGQATYNDTLLGKVTLQWNTGVDLSKPLTYRIFTTDSTSAMNFAAPIDSTQDTIWVTKCLSQNKTYYYGVRAVDKAGNVDTNTVVLSAKLPMLADFNGDGAINGADLLIFKDAWLTNDTLEGDIGPAIGTPPNWQSTRDHKVDFEDVMVLALGWKWSVENPVAAPSLLSKKTIQSANSIDLFDVSDMFVIQKNEEKPYSLKIKTEQAMAGVDFALQYDTAKVLIDSITCINEKDFLFFRDINNKKGCSSISMISMYDSLYKYLANPGLIKIWIRARQRLIDEKISIAAAMYDYKAKLIGKTAQELILSYRPAIPTEFLLAKNYPNPFNPATTIEYQLPKDDHVTIKIYNILGQEVATLVNADQKQGYYSVKWNAQTKASGVYIYRLSTKDYVKTKKMVMLK